MKEDLMGYLMIFFIIIVIIKIYNDSEYNNLTCVVSTVDGNKYCVRERENIEKGLARTAATLGHPAVFAEQVFAA